MFEGMTPKWNRGPSCKRQAQDHRTRPAQPTGSCYRAHQLRLRRWTVAAPSIGLGPEAMPRQLRWPWSGGFVGLARAAGIDRIELGRAPQISATCSASAALLTLVTFTAAIVETTMV